MTVSLALCQIFFSAIFSIVGKVALDGCFDSLRPLDVLQVPDAEKPIKAAAREHNGDNSSVRSRSRCGPVNRHFLDILILARWSTHSARAKTIR